MTPDEGAPDYIVVGSGAGGGPLAANLARAGKRVLLLEAGGDAEPYTYQVPSFHAESTEDPQLRWDYFVRHYADDQRQRLDDKFVPAEDGVLYPRAGTLGGCTAHNAMITIYPHNHDWDEIAATTGDSSWRSDAMRSYFERMEDCQYADRPRPYPTNPLLAALARRLPFWSERYGNPGRHGFDGWLPTCYADPRLIFKDSELLWLILDAAKQALSEDLLHPLTALEGLDSYPDPNDWRAQLAGTAGLWLAPMATNAGRRNGTREYIRKVQGEFPDRLIVKTNTLVTRVLFEDGNRAVGVEFIEGAHQYRADPNAIADPPRPRQQVSVRSEVILAAGAFNTPQLLMLSGVGAADELREFGIPIVVDLPGVGKNLQDRYEVGVVNEMRRNFALLEGCGFAPPTTPGTDPCFTDWQHGRGVYTTNGVVLGITKKAEADREDPDLFIFGFPANFHGYYPGYSADLERSRNLFTWAILKAHTRNTAGTVRLKSADPRDVPAINFRYFEEGNDTEGEDLESLTLAIEFVRRLTVKAGSIVVREKLPGPDVRSQEQLEDYVRRQAWGHHASCTCKIGPESDPTAVVDSRFRVHGTKNLRVVDASVFPHIPGFFIVSAVYMISEKASDVILADPDP